MAEDDNYPANDEHDTFGAEEFDQDEVDGGAREDVWNTFL